MLNDPIANMLSLIENAEKVGKSTCTIKPVSKLMIQILDFLNKKGYVGNYEVVASQGGDELVLNLIGKINRCNAIKPRHAIKADEIENFEKRFLPAKEFGVLIISTSQGVMTNEDAKKKKIGGKLIAFCY